MRSIFFIALVIFTNTVFSQAVNGVKTVNGVAANSSGEITISGGGGGITLPQLTDSLNLIRAKHLADSIAQAAIINSKLSNITGLVTAGTGATVTGSGTSGSPYVIGASGGSIKTRSPLQVNYKMGGDLSDTLVIRQSSATDSGYLSKEDWVRFNNGSTTLWNTNANGIDYRAGKVGIGTNLPAYALNVVDSSFKNAIVVQPSEAATSLATIRASPAITMFSKSWNVPTSSILNAGWGFSVNPSINVSSVSPVLYFGYFNGTSWSYPISTSATTFSAPGMASTWAALTSTILTVNAGSILNRISDSYSSLTASPLTIGGNVVNQISGASRWIGVDIAPNIIGRTGVTVIGIRHAKGDNYLNTIDGSTGIGVTDAGLGGVTNISTSAKLQVNATDKGFLPPRMTTAQKNAISSPSEGLIVYDLTLHKLCIYTGSAWETITSL